MVEVEVKEHEGTNFKSSGAPRSAKYPHKTHLLFDRSAELTAEASTSTKGNYPVLKKVYTVAAGESEGGIDDDDGKNVNHSTQLVTGHST